MGNPSERLAAARSIRLQATAADRDALSKALHSEPIPRIRGILQGTLRRVGLPTQDEAQAYLAARESAAGAVQDTAQNIVHTVRKLQTLLLGAAESEIPDFLASKTNGFIARMDRLLDAIERLGRAAGIPRIEDFDLAALIRTVSESEAASTSVGVELQGPTPLTVFGDQGHIDLAISNGLRNAIEASRHVRPEEPPPVVISWDETDETYWIVILDRGIGLPTGSANAFRVGVTTKSGHDGVGLAMAKQAMQSLQGDVVLKPRNGGGTAFEIWWPRDGQAQE